MNLGHITDLHCLQEDFVTLGRQSLATVSSLWGLTIDTRPTNISPRESAQPSANILYSDGSYQEPEESQAFSAVQR